MCYNKKIEGSYLGRKIKKKMSECLGTRGNGRNCEKLTKAFGIKGG